VPNSGGADSKAAVVRKQTVQDAAARDGAAVVGRLSTPEGLESASRGRQLLTMTDHRSQSINELLANPNLDANINPVVVVERIGYLIETASFSRERARTTVLKCLCAEHDLQQAKLLDPEYVDKDEPRTPDAKQ
jgi:hypothetical protein